MYMPLNMNLFNKLRGHIHAFTICLSIGLCLFAPSPVSAGFQPNETLVSSEPDLIDPEYDQQTSQFVWADSFGKLWIGKFNANGMFWPVTGKAILVDSDAQGTGDLKITANGPEWIQSNNGPQIVYTKFLPGQPRTTDNARLARAQLGPDGQWTYGFLDQENQKNAPYGSKDLNDSAPRISYVDPDLKHYWREVNNPSTEELIPQMSNTKRSVRWVEGARAVIFPALSTIDNLFQVFLYNVDTKVLEQLTFDDGDKGSNAVWMWKAPEYDNDYVFFVTVNTGTTSELRLYRKIDADNDGNKEWTKIFTSVAPPNSEMGSPEPFTYNGHSYIFMQLSFDNQYPTAIWLSNIDPAKPLFRKVTDDTVLRWRFDPEVVILPNKGPFIYYSRGNRDPSCATFCYDGIYRADTGLRPNIKVPWLHE